MEIGELTKISALSRNPLVQPGESPFLSLSHLSLGSPFLSLSEPGIAGKKSLRQSLNCEILSASVNKRACVGIRGHEAGTERANSKMRYQVGYFLAA